MFQQMCHIFQSKAFAMCVSAPESFTADRSNGWEELMVLRVLEYPSGNMTWHEGCRDSGRTTFGQPEGDEASESCSIAGSMDQGVVPWWRVKMEGVCWESMPVLVIFVKSMQAKRVQMREQWGLEEEVLDVTGSGGAAGLNSKYIISREPEGTGRLICALRYSSSCMAMSD